MKTETKHSAVEFKLAEILRSSSGMDLADLDRNASFLELGFDSLFLIQFSQRIKQSLGVKVTFRQMIEDLASFDALIGYLVPLVEVDAAPSGRIAGTPTLDLGGPTNGPVVPPSMTAAPATNGQAIAAGLIPHQITDASRQSSGLGAGIGLEQIIAQQNELMAMQLQLLEGPIGSRKLANSSSDREGVPVSENSGQKKDTKRFGPYKPLRRSPSSELTANQQAHLDALIKRLTAKTAKSKAHSERHREHFADPRGVACYRRMWKSMVYQITVSKSAGSQLWDIDGNEYIDIAMGFGLNLFGQSPAFLTDTIKKQLDCGIEVGPQSPLAGEVAQLLCDLTRKDRATFCNTGSEAVMGALRIARTVTGKSKVIFFNQDYHGNFDEVLMRCNQVAGNWRTSPASPGVPSSLLGDVIVLPYGAPESLDYIRSHTDELAAVLVEPVQSANPLLQPREFLKKVRQITAESNVAMIMDEVITGFRAAQGGVQELFDVWADIATYGKILGGGMPIGAIAGSARYMDALDGGMWRYDDDSDPTADMTFFAGTFVRHPLAMAAAHQVLMKLKEEGPELQQELTKKTERLADRLNEFFEKELYPIRIAQFASQFRMTFPTELQYADLLYFHLLDRGIFMRGWQDNCFLSTVHTDEQIETVIDAVKDSCEELRAGGFLPHPQTTATEVSLASTRDDSMPSSISTLIPIQEEGTRPPLFCMPAADGLTLVYHALSECLGSDQPVYGLHSPGVFKEPIPDTLEALAKRFIHDLKEVQPSGPYFIAGYCSGGTTAIEVARQLLEQGDKVAILACIETYNWNTAPWTTRSTKVRAVYELERIRFHWQNFCLLSHRDKRQFLASKLSSLRKRTRVWRAGIASRFRRSVQSQTPTRTVVNMSDIWKKHDELAEAYVPPVYPGRLIQYRPCVDYQCYMTDELQAESMSITRLPNYPAATMARPFVEELASRLKEEMDAVIETKHKPRIPSNANVADSVDSKLREGPKKILFPLAD
ncbi:Glutamate-1-semialdehyde 2,1-aminomutase [Novipirellula aureliae]|uniref:Glutamate-1-semialdehyde 2,1-aminomutase n=1 Tax=Novipirellula aureliae TaxID=2527966 RepID=A0A5C6EDG1_9BACT|nr:aminotransferase class III-fold pyridoxal phosphate-dependent enzyme [Novipirellula aureliae]TWU45269.1 Glutamate-1-semialdehyde 2,1-aminomutase [Novipirellula aureliae]